ncbi:PT domain-containing protein [Nocardiopsis sp. M1B1]|uniref:PT domain-containing protein n=1 Tax=Nocardiopsis sp. M1B1 TaxID=3450454 RepID=UPI004038FB54
MAVLAVIAVLAGASFLGGGLAVGGRLTGLFAAVRDSESSARPSDEPTREAPTGDPAPTAAPEPTEEPSAEPTDEPTPGAENLISSEELIDELRRDFEIDARLDITDEVCGSDPGAEETTLFQCTSSMDTNLVRVAAFESSGIAMIAAMAMQESEENTAADIQDACHFVLVWFEESGLDQQERDDMAEATREIVGCP